MENKKFWILGGLAAAIAVIFFWKKASASTARWHVGDILAGQHEGWSFEITITNVRFNSATNEWEYLYQHTGQLPQTWWVSESIMASMFGL